MWIRKLRRLPCWEQVIKKLIAGESVTSVAKWLVDMELEGEFKSIGYEGWRKYLGALKARIDMAGLERKNLEPLKYRAVVEEFARQKNSGLLEGNAVPSLRSLQRVIEKVAVSLDAEIMLKYCFIIQQGRLAQMLEFEERAGVLMPKGYNEVAVLKNIAAEVRKLEVGNFRIRGRGHSQLSGQHRSNPFASPAPEPLRELVVRFNELDSVDRNVVRSAATRLIELVDEKLRFHDIELRWLLRTKNSLY